MRPPRRPYHYSLSHYPVHNDHGGDDTAVVVPDTDRRVRGASVGGQVFLSVGFSDEGLSQILQVTLFICQTKYTLQEEKIHWNLISGILRLSKYNTVAPPPNQHFLCYKSENIRDSNSQPCNKQPF